MKPGGGKQGLSLIDDGVSREPSPEGRAELEEFNRSWVKVAVDQALDRLERRDKRHGIVVRDPIETDGESRADVVERIGSSPAQLPVLEDRARPRSLDFFMEEFGLTVGDEESHEEEIQALAPSLPWGARPWFVREKPGARA